VKGGWPTYQSRSSDPVTLMPGLKKVPHMKPPTQERPMETNVTDTNAEDVFATIERQWKEIVRYTSLLCFVVGMLVGTWAIPLINHFGT
jgi:hypothetical protein